MPRRVVLTVLCAILVTWPFFQYPGTTFYNRYFEAFLIFNPSWTFHSDFAGWSSLQHLGYPTLTEIVYLSVQTLVVWALHAIAGTALTSKIYPALIQLWLLGSFLFFARKKYPQVPYALCLLAALFFTVNPIAAAAIHEGYSGMLVDYALFPWTLLLIDYAFERRIPAMIALVPLLYTVTSMFKFPEVAINLAALLIFRWNEIVALLRVSRTARVLVVLAFCVNLYWVLPIVLNAATHRSLPIQTDTQSEVAVTTHYSTLSNVVLGRVFGMFGADAHLCSGCSYYESAYFNAAMLAIVIAAVAGLLRARRWKYLIVLIASVILATGYHYQDALIGIPYQILMGLPTMQVFRAANVFSMIEFFCISVGLLNFLAVLQSPVRIRRWYAAGATLAVALAGLPLLAGTILEHGEPPQATFFVRVPHAYAQARAALPRESDGVTLLLPNQGFAAYTWGAAVQDFLPAYIGRASISNWYWPQPSTHTQRVLDDATSTRTPPSNIAGALSAMRVDSVLIHNDVRGARPVNASRYGRTMFASDGLHVTLPPLPPAPAYQAASSVLRAGPGSAAPIAGWTGDLTAVAGGAIPCGNFGDAFALAPQRARHGVSTFAYTARCSRPVQLVLLAQSATAPQVIVRDRHGSTLRPAMRRAGTGMWRAVVRLPKQAKIVVMRANVRGIVFTTPRGSLPNAAAPLDARMALGAWTSLHLDPGVRAVAVNQSSDPSWQLIVWNRGGPQLAPKFVANGYANGWIVPPGADVTILNVAQIAFLTGCLLSLAALIAGVALAALSVQRYHVRAGLAAQD